MRRWFGVILVAGVFGVLVGCDGDSGGGGTPDLAGGDTGAGDTGAGDTVPDVGPNEDLPIDVGPGPDGSGPNDTTADAMPEVLPPVDTVTDVGPGPDTAPEVVEPQYVPMVGDASCAGLWVDPAAPDPVVFAGEIHELLSDNPLRDITVGLYSGADDTLLAEAVTDADGLYRIEGLPAAFPFDGFYSKLTGTGLVDTYGFNNRPLGMDLLAYDLTGVAQAAYNTLRTILELNGAVFTPETGVVSGRIVGCDGENMGGLLVRIDPAPEGTGIYYRYGTMDFREAGPGIATVQEQGSFAIINVPPGNYTVTVSGSADGIVAPTDIVAAPVKCAADAVSIQIVYVR